MNDKVLKILKDGADCKCDDYGVEVVCDNCELADSKRCACFACQQALNKIAEISAEDYYNIAKLYGTNKEPGSWHADLRHDTLLKAGIDIDKEG